MFSRNVAQVECIKVIGVIIQHTSLSFDLLASPPGRLNRSGREFAVRADLFYQGKNPVLAVVFGDFAVGEGIREIAVKLLSILSKLGAPLTQ